jgi:uncharacterized membrane protein YkvA (DUF1232 family)
MAKKRAGTGKATGAKRARGGRSRAQGYAERVMEHVRDPRKVAALLRRVSEKLEQLEAHPGPLAGIWVYLQACARLIRAYSAGEYTALPVRSMVLVTVAIIYLVSPLDILPDFLPLIGLVDDAAFIGFVIAQVKRDLDAFMVWEGQRKGKKRGG